jgi:excisionase family DNA binding protein
MSAISQNKIFLTPSEVAKELRLDLLTIYKYIKNKKLLAIRFGRNYRIKRIDLDKLIKANKTF